MRQADIWAGVDRLIDRAPSLAALRAHRVHLLAARRWRLLGREVPPELKADEQAARLGVLNASVVFRRIREVYDGPVIVLKGPEAAARYPSPAFRPYRDLDLLVPDPQAVQQALEDAGFILVDDPAIYELDVHHLRPLRLPGIPLLVEIHKRPNGPAWFPMPSRDELLAIAIQGKAGLGDALALPPAHHALILMAHSWDRAPLRWLRDLVDVAALAAETDRDEIAAVAEGWGVARMWRTTIRAAEAVFLDEPNLTSLPFWAHNLRGVRDRTVLENHVEHLVSSFWALPARKAIRTSGAAAADLIRPGFGETWRDKARRSGKALRNALRGASEHEAALGPGAGRQKRRSIRR